MIVLKRSLYSRHTPKNLIKYKEYRDEDFDKMTKGQKLRALEKEDSDAQANTTKYGVKKLLKWGPAGAIALAAPAAVIAGKGHRFSGALAGGLTGAMIGSTIGYARGEHFARKEGHDRDRRSLRLARRMDENARKII